MATQDTITADATLVYNYHRMSLPLAPADAIFALCSLDIRVAERAATLFLLGFGKYIIFSGDVGKLTASILSKPEAMVLVQKPYMERRTYATFRKQWPDAETEIAVTAPELAFGEYPDEGNPRELVINVMVGDLVRIREYPKLGFQMEQEIPDGVWEANQRLIQAGYDGH